MADAGIVRNRAKIEAAIANAGATRELAAGGESLAAIAWAHRPEAERAPREMGDVPSITPESKALAKELKRRGFRFVGPTTAYAMMQAVGIVNDHVAGCVVRDEVEAERRRARERIALSNADTVRDVHRRLQPAATSTRSR